MRQMFFTERAILLKLNALGLFFLVLHAGVIDALTFGALKMDDLSHKSCLVCTLNWSPRPGLNW